jgi:hypothetical protein
MDKFKWLKAMASEHGPKSSTERLVLFAMNVYMDANGVCFPTTRTLAANTSLSQRSVITHIDNAIEHGWIIITEEKTDGQGWRRRKYQALIPVNVLKEVQHVNDKRAEGGSPPQAERAEPHDNNVLKEVQHNNNRITINNNGRSFLLKDGSKYHIPDEFYNVLQDSFPDINIDHQLRKLSAWCYANDSKRKTKRGAKRFVTSWMSNAKPEQTDNYQPKEMPDV